MIWNKWLTDFLGPSCNIEKFSKKRSVYAISGIRYIRFALNPVWVDIVEGDSLALFTAQM